MRPYEPTPEEIDAHIASLAYQENLSLGKIASHPLCYSLYHEYAKAQIVKAKTPPARVHVPQFVKRQTARSKYSHFDGTWEELANLVEDNLDKQTPASRPGVVLVPLDPKGFWSATMQVTPSTALKTSFAARQEGELPFIGISAVNGEKMPAQAVEIVLYSHDALAENNENETDLPWEIVSINARATPAPEPMHPLTMARNMLQLPGGTKCEYTGQQFAEAVHYWADKVSGGKP